MKPKKILTIVFTFWSTFLFSQHHQLISSAGGSYENGSGSICFTLGECITSTHISDGVILTQGFQQSRLNIVDIQDFKFQEFEILAYPNPVKDFVILKIEKPQGLSYRLFDTSGKILTIGDIVSTEYEISFTELAPSIYIIKLYQSEAEIKAFKIIKR